MEVKICPKCRKPVEAVDYNTSVLILWGGLDPRFRCRKCGYRGLPIVLTDEKENPEG
jgi:C4-type Zn-finger protein